MPRLPRFFVPDLPLHLIQRGNDRMPVFRGPDDFALYRQCLARAAREHDVAIHAYVLMTNHVHLLVTPGSAIGVPKMMQSIGRVYVQYFNRVHHRTGTLWEGRYKAAIVDDERYLLTCMRYIELNPVRARIVAAPDAFRWSSFRANAWGDADDMVATHAIYRRLGPSPAARQTAYRDLFRFAIADDDLHELRDATQHAWALGGETLCRKVEASGRRAHRMSLGRPGRGRSPEDGSRV